MAINKIDSLEDSVLKFEINNGDKRALDSICEKWGFRDPESALRFALAVLIKSSDKTVSIKDEMGKETALSPADSLLNKI